jgi:MFS family permease
MRPLGGVLFGHIADRHGRGRSLMISTAAMAISTLLIGCLSTAAAGGTRAPTMFVRLRMAQGLSIGGEQAASMTFLVEGSNPRRRGFSRARRKDRTAETKPGDC